MMTAETNLMKRFLAREYKVEDMNKIVPLLHNSRQEGKLIRESDGQFTGGIYSEFYDTADTILEFVFDKGDLIHMVKYKRDLYLEGYGLG